MYYASYFYINVKICISFIERFALDIYKTDIEVFLAIFPPRIYKIYDGDQGRDRGRERQRGRGRPIEGETEGGGQIVMR
jgi:hypothetical protein